LERERISRELHDGFNQMLTSTRILHELAFSVHPEFHQDLEPLLQELVLTSEESSHLSRDLATHFLKDFGLEEALAGLAPMMKERYGIEVEFFGEEPGPLNERKALQIYRLIQEALHLSRVQGQSTEISLQMLNMPEGLRIMVEDNGKGNNQIPEHNSQSPGSLIRDRVRILHGNLEIDSSPGKGSVMIIEIPHNYAKNTSFSSG